MKKHVCPQKWTVKVVGIYLTDTITIVWEGKRNTQSASIANIKKNKTKREVEGISSLSLVTETDSTKRQYRPARLQGCNI